MSKITDLAFLQEFTKGDSAKMEKYIRMFLKNAPGQLSALTEQLSNKDWENLKLTVHSMKPQLSFMGAKTVESLAKELENNLRDSVEMEKVPEKTAQLKNMVEKVCTELQTDVENLQ